MTATPVFIRAGWAVAVVVWPRAEAVALARFSPIEGTADGECGVCTITWLVVQVCRFVAVGIVAFLGDGRGGEKVEEEEHDEVWGVEAPYIDPWMCCGMSKP